MIRTRIIVSITAIAPALAGCAGLSTGHVGVPPLPADVSFAFGKAENDDPFALRPMVSECLVSYGMKAGAPKPNYFVQLALTDRPDDAVLTLPDAGSTDEKRLASFSFSLTETKNAREVYRVWVIDRSGEPAATRGAAAFVEAACAELGEGINLAIKNAAGTSPTM